MFGLRFLKAVGFCAALGLQTVVVSAESIRFDDNWVEQGFLRLWSNDYGLKGNTLEVVSDGTVSLLYSRAPKSIWGAKSASWKWAVTQSVVATDLARKGGDDRNLALYFVFVDQGSAEKLSRASARKLLSNQNTRALVYVWGGDYARGTVLRSPYGPKTLKTIIRRSAGTGSFSEKVDLAKDFNAAFGFEPGVLIGIGVTADSDDTDGKIAATISGLAVN